MKFSSTPTFAGFLVTAPTANLAGAALLRNATRLVLVGAAMLGLLGNADAEAATVQALLKDGMFYAPEGNARFGLGPNNELIVENLGDSGLDGFRVLIGEAQGWSAQFVPFAISNNSGIISRMIGLDNQVVAEDRLEFVNGHLLGVANYHYGGSNAARRTSFEVRDEQLRLLDRRPVNLGEIIDFSAYLPPCGLANPPYHYERVVREDLSWWRICWPNCPGAPTGVVERTYCFVTTLPDPPPPKVRAVTVIAQRAGTVTMRTTSMRVLGHDHTGLGVSTMTASNGMLTLGNIGSSGQDGVAVSFRDLTEWLGQKVRGFDAVLSAVALAPGQELRASATGRFNGHDESPLGWASVRDAQGAWQLLADFAAVGSSSVRVDAYSGNALTGSTTSAGGGVLGVLTGVQGGPPQTPIRCYGVPFMSATPGIFITFPEPIRFNPPNGPSLTGDKFQLLAVQPSGLVETLQEFRITGANLKSFTIEDEIVQHKEPAQLLCPSNIVAQCQGPNGTPVNYTPVPTNFGSSNITVVCSPPSGSGFALGITTVQCGATDEFGENATCFFTVSIVDTNPPLLVCPTNLVVNSLTSTGVVVNYITPGAVDNCGPNLIVTCAPPSGSVFPIGTTRVTCTAVDDANNAGTCSFEVKVNPPPVIIREIIPPFGRSGDFITILGEGLPIHPDQASVLLYQGDGFIPLRAVDATPNRIVARLGPVPPNAQPALIAVHWGEGARGTCDPTPSGVQPTEPGWVLTRPVGMEGVSPRLFTPIYRNSETSEPCFFSGPPQNGALTLLLQGNLSGHLRASISLSAENLNLGTHLELDAPSVTLSNVTTTLDLGQRIAGLMVCLLEQLAGASIQSTVQETAPGVVQIIIRTANASIDRAHLSVDIRPPPPPVLITDVFPSSAAEGDLVAIYGSGFGNNPLGLTLAVREENSARMAPLEVLEVRDTAILARRGPWPPTFAGGPIVLLMGEGYRLPPEAFPEFAAIDPVRFARGSTIFVDPFRTVRPPARVPPPPPPPGATCFDAVLQGNQISIILEGNWPRNSVVEIRALLIPVRGADCSTPWTPLYTAVRLPSDGGTLMECAEIIARLLREMVPDFFHLYQELTPLPDGRIELKLRTHFLCAWENGYVTICVSEALRPEVQDVLPRDPLRGDVLTILGRGFGRDPGKLGLGLHESNGSRVIPLEVLSATDTRITARMGITPPDMQSAHLWISDGSGSDYEFEELATGGLRADDIVEAWRSRIDLGIETHVRINLTPSPPALGQRCFFSGPPTANGELCVLLNGTWTSNALISIAAAAHSRSSSTGAYHLIVPSVRLSGGGSVLECAQRIADFIRDAFWHQAAVVVDVRAELAPNNAKITLSLPNVAIDQGHIAICVGESPARPVITRFTPASGAKGRLITIQGSGLGDDPNDVQVALRDGTSPRLIPLEVVQVASTQLVARLGMVPPNAQPGRFMVQRGDGNRGLFAPASDDVELNNEFWVWRGGGPLGQSPDNFVPLHGEPPVGVRCFHSTQDPLDPYGSICLLMPWEAWSICPTGSLISVDVRIMDVDGTRFVPSLSGPVYFRGSGSGPECTDRIMDIIRRAVETRTGDVLLVERTHPQTNTVKITVRPRWVLDASRLTGSITVCIIPPALVPIIEAIDIVGSDIFVSLPTHLGFTYTLLHRQSLSAQSAWQPVASIPGDGTTRSLTHKSDSQRLQGFYRLRVE